MAKARTKAGAKKMTDGGSLGGFTIIEVVLVLAIAGLIFMMVFIALPNLQRAQRDTQRRTALGQVASAVQQYQANNNGRLPGAASGSSLPSTYEAEKEGAADQQTLDSLCSSSTNVKTAVAKCFVVRYLNSAAVDTSTEKNSFVDPDGWTYGLTVENYAALGGGQPTTTYADHRIHMVLGASCDGEDIIESNNPRKYALWYRLEGNSIYCSTNS